MDLKNLNRVSQDGIRYPPLELASGLSIAFVPQSTEFRCYLTNSPFFGVPSRGRGFAGGNGTHACSWISPAPWIDRISGGADEAQLLQLLLPIVLCRSSTFYRALGSAIRSFVDLHRRWFSIGIRVNFPAMVDVNRNNLVDINHNDAVLLLLGCAQNA